METDRIAGQAAVGADMWGTERMTSRLVLLVPHSRANNGGGIDVLGIGDGRGSVSLSSAGSCKRSELTTWCTNDYVLSCKSVEAYGTIHEGRS